MTPYLHGNDYLGLLDELVPELVKMAPIYPHKKAPKELKLKRLPDLKYILHDNRQGHKLGGVMGLQDLMDHVERHDIHVPPQQLIEEKSISPDDIVNIQFTSGTTGAPKGAALTHRNILNNAYFIGERLKYSADERVCIPVPLYHCFGVVLGNLSCMAHKSKLLKLRFSAACVHSIYN